MKKWGLSVGDVMTNFQSNIVEWLKTDEDEEERKQFLLKYSISLNNLKAMTIETKRQKHTKLEISNKKSQNHSWIRETSIKKSSFNIRVASGEFTTFVDTLALITVVFARGSLTNKVSVSKPLNHLKLQSSRGV